MDRFVALMILAFGAVLIGGIVWLTVRGWVKYPEERGKGGFPFNNSVPGMPVVMFDRWLRDLPEEPAIVIPAEKLTEPAVGLAGVGPGGTHAARPMPAIQSAPPGTRARQD
jgi:hypothetical protein